MAFVTLAELDQAESIHHRPSGRGYGLGQTPIPTCFLALPTNTSADEAQRRWMAMTEDQRQSLRAPYVAQAKASAATVTDDQARAQAEQRAVNDILNQVMRERVNPRLCTDVIRSLFYSTLGSPLSESLFTPDAVAKVKQAALANGVPADQIETLYAQARAALGPLPQMTPQQAVKGALEQVMIAAGVSMAIPLSYTRERVYAIRDEAARRGLGYEATRLVREEITRRVGLNDPNPNGDLEDLLVRLGSPQVQAVPVYTQPVQQPPVYAEPQQFTSQSMVQQAPPLERTRRQRPGRGRGEKYPGWVVPAAAAAGGALLILLVVNATKP